MPSVQDYEAAWSKRPAPRADEAPVELLVLRTGGGKHETPEAFELDPTEGVRGDRWGVGDEEHDPDCQVTLMNVGVARLVAGERPLHLPGDNVLVDLDLSVANLPVGARLRLGTALLEVGATPHTGCGKFAERFGKEALQWINGRENRPRRLRGVNCRVVEAGRVALGDTVRVLR